jgi:hypothetical protein
VSLRLIRAIRAVSGAPIAPKGRAASARRLTDEPLRAMLEGVELGTWALGPRSIDELVATVRRERPEAVMEFGSGSSTVALAWAIRDVWGPSKPPRLLSVEQDAGQAARTRFLLERAGLGNEAAVVHAPLIDQVIENQATTCYALPPGARDALGGRSVGLVMIDGPAGPPGVRFGTLPLARPFVGAAATFLVDDAPRDGELDCARRWSALPWVRIEGMKLVEKGLLVGAVVRS